MSYTKNKGSNGNPLQYSCLENPMEGGASWAAVQGVTRSQTQLRIFTFTFHFPALEKEMATQSSVLARRIPGMGGPGGLPSVGSHRVRHDWRDLAVVAAAVCPTRNLVSWELEVGLLSITYHGAGQVVDWDIFYFMYVVWLNPMCSLLGC